VSQNRDSGTGIIPSEIHPAAGAEDGDNSAPGEQYATRPYTQLGRRGRSGRRGRKRRPRSMGRLPFVTYLNEFLEDVQPFYSPATLTHMTRQLRYIHRILQQLRGQGLLATTNPLLFKQHEIGMLLNYMNARDGLRSRPMGPTGQRKLLQYLGRFLEHCGNPVLQQMKVKRVLRIPKEACGPLPCPSEEQVQEIVGKLQEAAAAGDPDALGVLGMAVFCAYAGTRLKEIRLAQKGDLSLTYSELTVMHPKGEGAWGSPRKTRIVPLGRQALVDFMDLRARELERHGIADRKDLPLVPYLAGKSPGRYWNDAYLHTVKGELESEMGMRFDFRMLRRAYGQNALDRGARIDSVSVALGHSSTRTTETYYARRKLQDAFEDLERVYSVPGTEKCQIDR